MKSKGRIIKLLGGFYYIVDEDGKLHESRARGVFRHQKITPVVVYFVEFLEGEDDSLAYIKEVAPRKNILLRPPVANIDQILIFIPIRQPKYNLYLIDRMIAYYESVGVEIIPVISKYDLDEVAAEEVYKIYHHAGFSVFKISTEDPKSIALLRDELKDKTTALAGVSAAGKSTFINNVMGTDLETQSISAKTERGKHTTRHSELLQGEDGIYIVDTPGFSSLDLRALSSGDLRHYFREFTEFAHDCKFLDCKHINEPGCQVRAAWEQGEIKTSRYENYKMFYRELEEMERTAWR